MTVATWTKLAFSGPFDLAASAAFLEGFAPAARPDAARDRGELRFAFPAAPSWRPVGVVVRQERPDAPVLVRTVGYPSDVDAAIVHTRRILSLDVDGSGFAEVGARDPVVGELQRRCPGLHSAMTQAYNLDNPTLADLSHIAELWRPYRTWVAFLFRTHRESDTGESPVPADEFPVPAHEFPAPDRLGTEL